MVKEKVLELILILDWNSEKYRITKKLPRKLKVSEIPCNIKIAFTIPDPISLSVEGKVDITMIKAKEMIIEKL